MSLTDDAYQKALDVIRSCERPNGFFASGLPGGYEAVWARDSMITSLGAALAGDEFRRPFAASLKLLAAHQSELGLVPNCVGSFNEERQSDITFNSIDAPLWFIIGHYVYAHAYRDLSLLTEYRTRIEGALTWLAYQDPNADGIIVQQPTGDWEDAFPHKYGRVLSTQALYYAVLRLAGDKKRSEYIKRSLNGQGKKYLNFFDRRLGYFRPWMWKDHDGDKETEDWFDSFGNIFAVLSGLADPKIANSILNFIRNKKINRPYPVKAIWPPLKKNGPEWHSYFDKCNARTPYEYLNAGIWPFIGGFYVAALVKTKRFGEARRELELLAQANMQIIKEPDYPQDLPPSPGVKKMTKAELIALRRKEFNEWLHGRTGRPQGEPYQAWTAGTYLYAYECVKQKKVLFFE